MDVENSRLNRYVGSCHCGAVKFCLATEEIREGRRCNCSLCSRKGAVMSVEYFAPDRFELIQGKDSLSVYQFGDFLVNHYFCQHCGIYPFHDAVERPGAYRVNLGCVDGVDPLSLKIELIDGQSW